MNTKQIIKALQSGSRITFSYGSPKLVTPVPESADGQYAIMTPIRRDVYERLSPKLAHSVDDVYDDYSPITYWLAVEGRSTDDYLSITRAYGLLLARHSAAARLTSAVNDHDKAFWLKEIERIGLAINRQPEIPLSIAQSYYDTHFSADPDRYISEQEADFWRNYDSAQGEAEEQQFFNDNPERYEGGLP